MPTRCRRAPNTKPAQNGWQAFRGCQDTAWGGIYVYPGLQAEITLLDTGSWVVTQCPPLWQMPAGDKFVLNFDPMNGSDVVGVSDGLGPGVQAFKSADWSLAMASILFSARISSQFTIKCTLTTRRLHRSKRRRSLTLAATRCRATGRPGRGKHYDRLQWGYAVRQSKHRSLLRGFHAGHQLRSAEWSRS